mmetsp:Transcript_19436/g.27124  ORF Transcript_19436/g.27124 Transcript_19436/m.27124 type:complete len:196 (+) Transcript_19436:65-652(+)
MSTTLTPQQKWSHFTDGVNAVFSKWTALVLAVENGWGGLNSRRKAESMQEECLDMFKNGKVYPDELIELFYDWFLQDFNTDPQDGSVEQVSRLLVDLFNKIAADDLSLLNTVLSQKAPKGAEQSIGRDETQEVDAEPDDDDDDEDEEDEQSEPMDTEMDVDNQSNTSRQSNQSTPKTPVVDEDGWEVVTRKGKKK